MGLKVIKKLVRVNLLSAPEISKHLSEMTGLHREGTASTWALRQECLLHKEARVVGAG